MYQWSDHETAYKLCVMYQKCAKESDEDFVARKLAHITVYGYPRYQISDLMIWETDDGEIAFIDYDRMYIGVYCDGICYTIPIRRAA